MDTLINIGMFLVYALLILAILATVGFSIYQFAGNFKQSKTTLYGIVGLIVIFIISYLLSSGSDISEAVFEKVGANYGSSKLIGSGLILFYILFGITLLTLIVTEIARPLKK
ncbi:MAG: hypothetical protein K2O66_05430 [Bacteroidales bacterium]|nr:hypothetical protein [Bacteroidales bacterium]MDE7072782.1 hypothetical protein [Bacteroidales bacterium]